MAKSAPSARARYERLKAEHAQLRADFERLKAEIAEVRETIHEHTRDLRVQFTRIAEMQAVLDQERRNTPSPPVTRERPSPLRGRGQ